MLEDGKIDSLDTHLEQFKVTNSTNQNELQVKTSRVIISISYFITVTDNVKSILTEYTQLLEDYKILKRSHKQENGKSGSSSLGSNDARRSYVSVLVDGNAYFVRRIG